jgi:RimJ/RimL family protein N-acetyltransferase
VIELAGERVRLRGFRPEEHDAFVASRLAAEEGVTAVVASEAELRRRVAGSGELNGRGLLLAIDVGGRAAGEIQAYRMGLPEGVFGIGIGLFDEADRGRGIGTEATAVLVRYVFETLGARRVEAGTHVGNAPMMRVLERLGFAREGVLRRYFPSASGGLDCAIYAMTRDDWESEKDRWTRTS